MLRHPHGARRYRLPGARHPAVSVRAHGQPGDCRAQREDDRRPTAPAAPDRERAAAAVGVRSLLGAFAPGWTALRQAAPGVCIAIALAAGARGVAHAVAQGVGGLPKVPLSPVMCAVLLGMLWRNSVGVPAWASSGLNWAMYRLLRVGIALLGLRLTLGGATAIPPTGLPVPLGCLTRALLPRLGTCGLLAGA